MKISAKNFNLRHTLEAGQCFEWEVYKNGYAGVVHDTFYYIYQDGEDLYVSYKSLNNHSEDHHIHLLKDYFNLDSDYSSILNKINIDDNIKKAIDAYYGIRIVNQPHLECLISFMLSANNTVNNIQNSRRLISEKYGNLIFSEGGKKYFSFPDFEKLKELSEESLRECKVGFRAKFIYEALKTLSIEDLTNIEEMTYVEAKERLMKIKGIGEKIADCILLYSYRFPNVYPTDTWVKKFTKKLYFNNENIDEKKIREFGITYFNGLAGWAQLFLYIHSRENKGLF